MTESEIFPRFSATVAGLTATMHAAIRPAAGPASRCTARYSTSTVRTPSAACGATITQVWKPKARTASACSQKAPGSLSRVMVPAGSKAP
jgi:hypothetical protein